MYEFTIKATVLHHYVVEEEIEFTVQAPDEAEAKKAARTYTDERDVDHWKMKREAEHDYSELMVDEIEALGAGSQTDHEEDKNWQKIRPHLKGEIFTLSERG